MAELLAGYSRTIAELTAPGGAFEVTSTKVRGVPVRAYTGGPRSLRDVLELSRGYGDREFLVYEDDRWTFERHFQVVAGLASHLVRRHGVRKGDRVAIAMRNYPEWLPSFWACQVIGAIAVPLNAWWTGTELAYALRDSGAVVLIADDERYQRIAGLLGGLDALRVIMVVRGAATADSGVAVEPWDDMLAGLDPGAALPDAGIDIDDDATIMYTSGTTGRPKGAIATHRNHCTNLVNTVLAGTVSTMLAGAPAADPPAQLVALQTFPFFHIGGLSGLYVYTAAGARLVLMYKWDVDVAVELAAREGATAFAMVPTLLRQLLEHPAAGSLTSLASIAAGGAPVPPDLITGMGERYAGKVSPVNAYGLTETTSAVVTNSAGLYFEHPDSVGLPVPGTDVRVVGADGTDVPPGQIGELWVSGPNVVRGYWDDPEATAAAFTDGWFHTGDLGRVDDSGLIYVVDRLKDMVLRGGENVYCAEVEAALFEHPAVSDVAVVGIPHRSLGEEVAAVVLLRDGADVTTAELQDHAGLRIAAFKVPSRIFFRDQPLPRNATGKVLKRQLRDELANGQR